MTWHGDKSPVDGARSRRRRGEEGSVSFALLWKVGAMVPISVLAAALLVGADGGAPEPAEPSTQEQVVEAVPETTVPPRTTLRRAVQSVSPTPVPVPQVESEVEEIEQVEDAEADPSPTRHPVRPSTPEPSPTRTASPPPPSPSPTPDEAREQCIEQGAPNLAACVRDLLNG